MDKSSSNLIVTVIVIYVAQCEFNGIQEMEESLIHQLNIFVLMTKQMQSPSV